MSYTFKLEALRQFREFEEERVQREFSQAQRILEAAASKLAEQIAVRDKTETEFAAHQESGTASQCAMYRGFLQRLAEEIELLNQRLRVAERDCEKKRQALLAAVKNRKTLDRLKEKDEQAYRHKQDQEEGKFIDEMAINRFQLNRG